MLNPTQSTIPEYPSLRKLDELLPLRGLAATTHEQYRRTARKLAARAGRDPAELDEAAVRAHLLHLKTDQNYAPSSMRAACAALRFCTTRCWTATGSCSTWCAAPITTGCPWS
jgi:hypothetical protein